MALYYSWRRKWQPAPVFLPGKFHGQRCLAGYSPWDCKESDTTEQLSMHTHSITPAKVHESIISIWEMLLSAISSFLN